MFCQMIKLELDEFPRSWLILWVPLDIYRFWICHILWAAPQKDSYMNVGWYMKMLHLINAWKAVNPKSRNYTFYSERHQMYSIIDICWMSKTLLINLKNAEIVLEDQSHPYKWRQVGPFRYKVVLWVISIMSMLCTWLSWVLLKKIIPRSS